MAVLLNRRAYGYSKIENEDPEEKQHRLAQFLIYKAMQKVDMRRNRPSWLRVKISKLKVKFGKRLKRLRKRFATTLFSAKSGLCKRVACVVRSCKNLVHAKQGPIVRSNFTPVF